MAASWVEKADPNPKAGLMPPEYLECFERALRRMSVTLNLSRLPSQHPREWLRLSDERLRDRVRGKGLDESLWILFHVTSRRAPRNDDVAEHYFYGWFEFRTATSSPRFLLVEYYLRDGFLAWSYEGLHQPEYTAAELGLRNENPSQFMASSATNYILKNFWHNYAHTNLQGITQHNYHDFGGDARFESDFEADNIATLLLARSYGFPVVATGFANDRQPIIHMLRRNRCNDVFALRALRREPIQERQSGGLPAFHEQEWLFRRAVGVYLSGWLLASGRAVASLGVYLSGAVRQRKAGYCRVGNPRVVVELNRMRIATEFSPPPPSMRRNKEKYRSYVANIARDAAYTYVRFLRENDALEKYAARALEEKFELLGVPLTASSGSTRRRT